MFHILRLSGNGLQGVEFGPWKGIGQSAEGSGWKTGQLVPQSSRWPWPQVLHLPDDSVPLRHIPHQGWSKEAAWKLKSLVLSLLPRLPLTVWSWTKPSSSLGSSWKWVFLCYWILLFIIMLGQGQVTAFFLPFSSSLYSRNSLPWLAGTSNN